MPTISNSYVRLLFEHLEAKGLDPVELLGRSWPDLGNHAAVRTSASEWMEMLDKGASATGEPAFGVQVAKRYDWSHIGLYGYLIRSSQNAIEALGRAERFHSVASEYNPVKVTMANGEVVLSWPLQHGAGGQLWDEFGIATGVRLMRMISGTPVDNLRIDFCGAEPSDMAPYHEFFCPNVSFEKPMPSMAAPLELLAKPISTQDDALVEGLEREAYELLTRLEPKQDEIQRFHAQLLQLMPQQKATLEALASRLNCSERTLQRQLAALGVRFSDLLTELRKETACNYLKNPQYSLSDVAELLGYADQSVFTRAFGQWFAVSPRAWRQQNGA